MSVRAASPGGFPFSCVRAGVTFLPVEKGCLPVTPLEQCGAFPQNPWLAHLFSWGSISLPPQLARYREGGPTGIALGVCLNLPVFFFLAEVAFPVPKPALISQLESGEAPWGPDPWAEEVWSSTCPGE